MLFKRKWWVIIHIKGGTTDRCLGDDFMYAGFYSCRAANKYARYLKNSLGEQGVYVIKDQ